MNEERAYAYVGHPTEGVFMKCWRCQEIHRLEYDGHSGLQCPACREKLIPLEIPELLQGRPTT
jgi:DNA-directed RNA polymerase subunit RPC12/RpoP